MLRLLFFRCPVVAAVVAVVVEPLRRRQLIHNDIGCPMKNRSVVLVVVAVVVVEGVLDSLYC